MPSDIEARARAYLHGLANIGETVRSRLVSDAYVAGGRAEVELERKRILHTCMCHEGCFGEWPDKADIIKIIEGK